MLILLDTSALIWWMNNDKRLGPKARAYIADESNQIVVSAISILEYEIKSRLKKLPPIRNFKQLIQKQSFFPISYTVLHAESAYAVPHLSWKDPFDIALVGKAKELRKAHFLTSDRRILTELGEYISCIDAKK
jgi:PIN domain nuclease of toxin-antitoxin system